MKVYNVGYYIKRQREEQQISQDDLCRGICDKSTLSRIERGKQDASYFVLKALLQRLGLSGERCQVLMGEQDFQIEELQREIVSLNARENFEQALQKITELEKMIQEQNLENDSIHKQFLLRVKSLIGYEQDGQHKEYTLDEKRELLIQALKLTRPDFDFEKISKCLLGIEEIKILNQIANTYSEEGNCRYAIHIYEQLFSRSRREFVDTEKSVALYTMLAYNYSRLLGLERRYEECIEIAQKGQDICIQYNKTVALGGLLLNIAYAQHELGQDEESKGNLTDAYYAYKLIKNQRSCQVVKEYAEKTFKIER